jgi:hypothetical protein
MAAVRESSLKIIGEARVSNLYSVPLGHDGSHYLI